MKRVWDTFLTDQDVAHLAALPRAERFGFGEVPVVLSVDNYRGVIGDEPEPLLDAINTWPESTGLAGWTALSQIEELFGVARDTAIPVIHITGLSADESGVAGWARPRPGADATDADDLSRRRRRYEIVEQAGAREGEAVLRKTAPSAFFGTPLLAHLNALGADTLIVCGESTSGCVRATVVDGRSFRFRVVVVEDCVYDRHEASHAINLFDMDQKYADVLPLDEVVTWMRARRDHGGPGARRAR